MTRFLVIGAAGHAQEVAWSLREQERVAGHEPTLTFFDDTVAPGMLPSGLGVVAGPIAAVGLYADDATALVLGIGLPRTKAAVLSRLGDVPLPWRTVVHPRATIGPNVSIGDGSYVAAGAIVTVNVQLGDFVTVNMHCQVAHDGIVGDFATLHPDTHLAGHVTIGSGCELGTGSVVVPGCTLGPWTVLGAGAVAVRSLEGEQTYVGIPASRRHPRPTLRLVRQTPD